MSNLTKLCKTLPNFDIEEKYNNLIVAGVDEAGRGPLAGPVVAAAVIVDRNKLITGINDSKAISAHNRERLYSEITTKYSYAVGIISSEEIDRINILEATKAACILAVSNLSSPFDIVLVDGNMKFTDPRFISIIKGDQLSYSIAAASIVAKVTRDKIMQQLATEFPQYNWHKNVGYGTKEHGKAIEEFGLTMHHRKTFNSKKY